MNSSKLKVCLGLLQGSNNLSSRNLLKQVSKCSVIHVPERCYFLDFILGRSKLIHSPDLELKRDDITFRSLSFMEAFKIRRERKMKIQEVLECSSADANSILNHGVRQSSFDDQEMFYEKLECLRKAGLDAKLILDNLWLLNVSLGELEKKLEAFLSRSHTNFEDISLLKLSRLELEDLMLKLQDDENFTMESRIDFFCREFNLPVPEVCELLVERWFLRRRPLREIISIYKQLLSCGVTPNEISTDFWVFNFSKELITRRIELAKFYGLDRFRCWMVRCHLSILKRSGEIVRAKEEALGEYPSKDAFLINELGISQEELQGLFSRNKQLQTVGEVKLRVMFDFLRSENFSNEQIVSCLRIVCHSPRKLKKRIDELRSLNFDFRSLSPLCTNTKTYHGFVELLKSRQEKADLAEDDLERKKNRV